MDVELTNLIYAFQRSCQQLISSPQTSKVSRELIKFATTSQARRQAPGLLAKPAQAYFFPPQPCAMLLRPGLMMASVRPLQAALCLAGHGPFRHLARCSLSYGSAVHLHDAVDNLDMVTVTPFRLRCLCDSARRAIVHVDPDFIAPRGSCLFLDLVSGDVQALSGRNVDPIRFQGCNRMGNTELPGIIKSPDSNARAC